MPGAKDGYAPNTGIALVGTLIFDEAATVTTVLLMDGLTTLGEAISFNCLNDSVRGLGSRQILLFVTATRVSRNGVTTINGTGAPSEVIFRS